MVNRMAQYRRHLVPIAIVATELGVLAVVVAALALLAG